MGTRFSIALIAAVALSGCAESGGGKMSSMETDGPSFRDTDTSGGTPIKVSYVRFNEQQDPQTRVNRFQHWYRFMLSQGWMNKKGPRAHEPFERIWRDAFKAEGVGDKVMEELVRQMMAAGFGDLHETPMESIDVKALQRIEKTNDRVAAQRSRYITVETEGYRKTVSYNANDDSRGGKIGVLTQKFIDVEKVLNNVMGTYTIQVTTQSDSSMPRSRK